MCEIFTDYSEYIAMPASVNALRTSASAFPENPEEGRHTAILCPEYIADSLPMNALASV